MTTPIHAVGIKGAVDSLSQIRLAQPLRTLSKEGDYVIDMRLGNFEIDWAREPGVFVSYRLHPDQEKKWQEIDEKCAEGWLWVHDVDDDPRYLNGQKAHKFRSIAGAHLITVSSPELVKICQVFNPNVVVIPNQIGPFPPKNIITQMVEKPKVFFGALNRSGEWEGGLPFVVDALREHEDHIELYTINDPDFAKSFPEAFPIRNLAHQNYREYLRLIDYMDIALIPLADNEFNRSKSDLKIIEALAHGMIPIISRFAAENTTVPKNYMRIVSKPEDWSRHLNDLLDEPQTLHKQKEAGYDYISKNRLWSDHGFEIDATYQKGLKDWTKLEDERQLRIRARREMGLPG